MPKRIEIKTKGMHEMERDFEKASIPNLRTKSINKLDNLFSAAAAAVKSKVHVDTGYLKLSGRSSTHYVGDLWIGEIRYAHDPGIFELARGDKATGKDHFFGKYTKKKADDVLRRNHPTGGHFFFNAVEPFEPFMEAAVNDMFDDYFGKADL